MRKMLITVETNEKEVGSIIADILNRKGARIENVSVIEEVPHTVNKPKAANGAKHEPKGTTGTIEVIKLLKSGKAVPTRTFSKRMAEVGLSGANYYSSLARFIKQGYVRKLPTGEYEATDSGLNIWRAK